MFCKKVVVNQSAGTAWDTKPLPAYQYFENIRNFLVAVEELKLPSFEASDLERVSIVNYGHEIFSSSRFTFHGNNHFVTG